MNYENSRNESEILSADDEKLRELCRSLKKREAPKDFDFKLKARIANSKSNDFQPRFGFAFRYALPALALILGLLAYNSGFLSSSKGNQFVAESSIAPTNPALPQNTAVSNYSVPETKEQPNDILAALPPNQSVPTLSDNVTVPSKPKMSRTERKHELKNDDSTRSEDKAVKRGQVILPKGFDQKTIPQTSPNQEKPVPQAVKGMLSMMGINAVFENGKWTVKSVESNGVELKENDIIEALDDQPLSTENIDSRVVNFKTFTVMRNGEKLIIRIQSKQ
jgi:hypothetical protein